MTCDTCCTLTTLGEQQKVSDVQSIWRLMPVVKVQDANVNDAVKDTTSVRVLLIQ